MNPFRWGCFNFNLLGTSWRLAKKTVANTSRRLRMESLNDRLPMAADAFEPLDNADSIEQAIVSLDPSIEIKKNDAESATCFDIPE